MSTVAKSQMTNASPLFYHGTSALAALCISVDGFRLLPTVIRRWGDGALGNGIYITTVLDTAAFFARICRLEGGPTSQLFVVRVRMLPGTRIMRLDGQYDPRIIAYLGREFGKELFSPKFDRAIPANKHLKGIELISLANYLWSQGEDGKRGGIAAWSGLEGQGPLRKYLVKHKYDGVGSIETDIGLVVFNPSRLLPDRILSLTADAKYAADSLSESDPLLLAATAAQSICHEMGVVAELSKAIKQKKSEGQSSLARFDRNELEALLTEMPRLRNCLRAFCKRQNIPTTGQAIVAALNED